jgi:hypothetical protein
VLPEISDITNLGLLLRYTWHALFSHCVTPPPPPSSAACLGVQAVLYGRGPEVFDQRHGARMSMTPQPLSSQTEIPF